MINLNIENMRGSQILVVQAAVLKTMEKVNFHPKEIHTELMEAATEGNLVMTFVKEDTSSEEIFQLQKEFGQQFTVKILGKSKNEIFLQLEAPREKFLLLGQRYTYRDSPMSQATP